MNDARLGFRTTLLAAATVLTLGGTAAGCDAGDRPESSGPDSGTVVSGDGWRGVLLGAGVDYLQRPDGTVVEDVDSFVPSEADVRRFEAALPAALPTATNASGERVTAVELEGYVRQYTGVEGDGARHLAVAGICDPEGNPDWTEGWIVVSDGGSCFWDATMDLATGDILRLYFHGQA